jgi:hypothetical protein
VNERAQASAGIAHKMPFFDQNPLTGLALEAGDADQTLDLRGLDEFEAIERVEGLLNDPGACGSYLVQFDAASVIARETLFLPVGRRLLKARRDGAIRRCLPVSDGTGYYIEFPPCA